MSNEDKKQDYPAWFIQLLQDVLDMRDAQKAYFTSPGNYNLKVAKVKEAKADELLLRFVNAKYISHKTKPENKNQLPPMF